MSEIYRQKQHNVEEELEHIELLSNIIPAFEDYVKETNCFIDKLLEETKEINTLRNIIKEVREYIGLTDEDREYLGIYDVNGIEILNILDKVGENK